MCNGGRYNFSIRKGVSVFFNLMGGHIITPNFTDNLILCETQKETIVE